MSHALISVKPEYVVSILSGMKTIELRRRPLNLSAGTKLWIYSTSPRSCVEAVVEIRRIVRCSPSVLWSKFREALCISRQDFDRYVAGCKEVTAIFLGNVVRLRKSLSLDKIRSSERGFQPPQFFLHLHKHHPVFAILTRSTRALSRLI